MNLAGTAIFEYVFKVGMQLTIETLTESSKTSSLHFRARTNPFYMIFFFFFIVRAKIIVTIALAVEAKSGVSHIPFSSQNGVRIKRNPIGNTSVPKKEVIKERAGRSSTVKKDEKHISTKIP